MSQLESITKDITNLFELEKLAKDSMSKSGFDYYAGGATDEITLKENVEAFRKIRLRPRMLRDVSSIDTNIELFGGKSSTPVLVAPMAFKNLLAMMANWLWLRRLKKKIQL